MRIGCLQFAPQVGDVSNNLNRADACLARADPMELENLDLLVLPEMAFSGYNFKSLEHIMPFLEPSGSGISALWARTSALKYDCIVAVGYPEKVDSSRQRRFSAPRYYNSLIMVNGDGETLANYRKSFLYYTDATWASEGDGFFGGEIDGLGQVAMGICMDINPYRFEMPWNTYEFGFHILEVKANLVILSMAWLTQEDPSTFTPFTQEPDMETISYWVQRLEPVIRKEQKDEIIVVFCNRCGIEDDVVYAGTSAVVGIKNGEVSVYGLLGRGVKELLIVNTDLPPFAKLVSREKVTEPAPEPLPHPTAVPVPPSMVSPAKASPTKDRLSRLPEADEPVEDPPATAMSSPTSTSDSHMTHGPPARSSGGTTPMTQVGPPLPIIGVPSRSPRFDGEHERGNAQSEIYGDRGGYSHRRPSETPDVPIPPTQVSMRPKLAITTGSISPPASSTKGPPTIADLCTPPMTAFDDAPMTAIDDIPMSAFPTRYGYSGHHPPPFPPPSANIITPEEPTWPVADLGRTPATSTLHCPPRQKDEINTPLLQAPPRPRGRPGQPRPVDSKPTVEPRLHDEEVQALRVAVGQAGFPMDIPARPEAPKSRNASRDASRNGRRSGSRESSRAPMSRDPSRARSNNTSKNGSRCPSRDQSRDRSREASREPSRNPSRGPDRYSSREASLNRGCERPSSYNHGPLYSDPVRGRSDSSRAKSTSPVRYNSDAHRDRHSESHTAAKKLLSSFKDSIPIAISSSLLSHEHGEVEVPPSRPHQRPAASLGHRRSRSVSASSGHHKHPPPHTSRLTADFSAAWSTPRHHEQDQQRGDAGGMRSIASFESILPNFQSPVVPQDEAFLGRTLSRAESWRQKRVPPPPPPPRRTMSSDNIYAGRNGTVEMVQPTFFF